MTERRKIATVTAGLPVDPRIVEPRIVEPRIVDHRVVDHSRTLLERADALFDSASAITDSAERYRQFYLAGLRGAGAVLAVREAGLSPRSRRGSPNAWRRLRTMAPELADAADYFAARSTVRTDIESGRIREVDPAACAEIRRAAADLLDLAEALIIAYEQGDGSGAGSGVPRSA